MNLESIESRRLDCSPIAWRFDIGEAARIVRPPIARRVRYASVPMAEFVLQIQDIDEQGKDYAFELDAGVARRRAGRQPAAP